MRLIFYLLPFFKVLAVWSTRPPQIEGEDERIVQEGDPLTLICRGSKPLQWTSLETTEFDGDGLTIKNTTHTGSALPYKSIFHVSSSWTHENGYYYCHYSGATDLKNDKDNVDSVYVFVHGLYAFVKLWLNRGKLLVSETLLIECATTHPDINVTLKKDGINIGNDERISFDPKEGFSIKDVVIDDQGEYTCEANDEELTKKVTITNTAKKKLLPPSINIPKNQHFVKGESFALECSVVDHVNITFTWKLPNEEAKHPHETSNEPRNNTAYQKSILSVSRASEADTGRYTCSINSEGAIPNSASVDIEVKENMTSFVNITSSEKINATEGELLTWKTQVQSYPSHPRIQYTNWRGEVLNQTDRIIIDFDDDSQSWLKINNISSSDFGNYTITVTTTDYAANSSTTTLLEVKSAPHMMVKGVPQFVVEGESLNVTCLAQGFPRATVNLLFQNYSTAHNFSCSSFSSIQKKVEINYPAPGNIVEKSILFTPNTSGLLWCCGRNNEEWNSKTAVIRISDIGGVFVLQHSGQDGKITKVEDHEKSVIVVENDYFSLMCGGTKFDYKSVNLSFSSQLGSQIPVQKDDSEFSWQTKKTAGKATKTLAGNYTCTAYPHEDKQPHVKSIIIAVADEEKVHFEKEMNMKNQTVVVKDDKPFNLNCNVTGTPTPTIQWMKDKKDLTSKSKFFDETAMHFSSDFKVLTFNYVSKKHEGVYTCTAKNRLNEVMGSLTLEMPGMSTLVKLGLIIAFLGMAALAVLVVVLMKRVKKEQRIRKSFKVLTKDLFEKGNIESLNPTFTADKQADMLPYDKMKWEVPRGNINLGKQLGSGAFGRVIKANVIGLEGPATTTVAVKMCKNDVDTSQMHALISELKIMMHLGKHLNIVNLIGASTVSLFTGELWILVEYCRFGSLLNFMQRHRRKFINQICPVTGKINHHLVQQSPMSPALSESYTPAPAVDQDGYLAPSTQKFVLSDPPLGHSAQTGPSSTVMTSSSGSTIPHGPSGQFASNPMYSMMIGTATEDPKEEPKSSEDSRMSINLQRKGSRLLSIGSIALSDSSSVSQQSLKSPDTNLTALTQQSSTHSPLSPTDSLFMGEYDPSYIHKIGSVPGVSATFSTTDLICWGWQVAQGMNYLSGRKILHGDLAARNLLFADNNVVKISDFGLSRNMYRNDNYVKKGDDLLPIKWLSIEAIRDRIFSIESDVWAFGITLWEIFSLGSTPYASMEINKNFVEELENGYRMGCPKYANQEIHKIMNQCWEECPLERPSFSQLVDHLGHMMIPALKEDYLSQNETYMQMNMERFKEETDYLNMMANPNFESKTMPDEPDGAHYVNVPDQTRNSNSMRMEFSGTVAYSNTKSPPSSCNLSPVDSNYLPMGSVKSQSPSSEPTRFIFPSSNPESSGLTSLPEEGKSIVCEPEEHSQDSTLTRQPPLEGNLSK